MQRSKGSFRRKLFYTKIYHTKVSLHENFQIYSIAEIFAWRKFSPFSPPALMEETFIPQNFCPMLMITCMVENLFCEILILHNGRAAGLGEIFPAKFGAV